MSTSVSSVKIKDNSESGYVPNGTSSHERSNGDTSTKTVDKPSNRKQRRKDWWSKRLSENSTQSDDVTDISKITDHFGDQQVVKLENIPEEQNISTEQRSKLRNRETIARPDSLKYEPDYNKGSHNKLMQNLYTETSKKKKKKNEKKSAETQKRKSTSDGEQDNAKKPKAEEKESEITDLYKFSLNLINGDVDTSKTTTTKDSKNKYVLFIGNLPYDITREQLEEHFRKTGGIKSIRIPREKVTDKGRGFAYMEFDGRISHGIALRLHHTTLGVCTKELKKQNIIIYVFNNINK
ncbi:RNA-binding protein 34 [Bulinus truncatus]|nr:RNA-binding protein 34 [Bulinus truncatus]